MIDITTIKQSNNLTDKIEESELRKIGASVVNGYKIDEESRAEWQEIVNKSMEIAKQVQTTKNFPWPKSSNIKFPLICEASIDFASRVLPELVPNDKVVRVSVHGRDPEAMKYHRAGRVEDYMSYQLMKSPDWYDGVDSLLHILPVIGTVFKKTYYCPIEKRNISEVCPPDRICVNYNTQSLDTARRITHRITLSTNDIIQRQRRELFNRDIDVKTLCGADTDSALEEDMEVDLLEQHCWLDLDDDGYKEPYCVTVSEKTGDVFRIVSRIKDIEKNSKGEVINITPWQYFTDFHFIKSPDGGFYSMGFGQLLLPINRAINSLINQLIDAGTLSTTQGGFLGKGLRLKDGDYNFKPFEWKKVDTAAGMDIKDNIFQFPVREPSGTLFQLLTLMIGIGKELSSSTKAMGGDMPGANVSTNTMNSLIEQGSKIFSAINKRLYRSMTKEYGKLYELNYYFGSNKDYRRVLDNEAADLKIDFDLESCDVTPVADPVLSSMNQKLAKMQALFSLRTADPRAVDVFMLQTLQLDEEQIAMLLPAPDPNAPPPPEALKMMAEAKLSEAQAANLMTKAQISVAKAPLEAQLMQKQTENYDTLTSESVARVWKMQKDAMHGDQKILIAGGKMQQQESLKQAMAQGKQEEAVARYSLDAQELQLNATKAATDAMLEDKKLDIMREKQNKEKSNDGKAS